MNYNKLRCGPFNKKIRAAIYIMTTQQIGKTLRELAHGKSFTVATKSERRMALVLAKGFGKRVHSRKNGKNGFTIHVLE